MMTVDTGIPWGSLQITLLFCVAIVCVTWWNVAHEKGGRHDR
ncbi:MAG TPA: hypothetical protein VD965_07580 [Burkholderiales bacterium]|nr:hypothetical protein [Burkholderiales bacterium]